MFRIRNSKNGFTIIEVLIVLAIAGLILAIIFLAVPAMTRNFRNYERKNAVNLISAELTSYQTDTGQYPLHGTAPGQDDRTAFVTGITDKNALDKFTVRYTDSTSPHEYPYSGSGAPAFLDNALDIISIQHGHQCNRNAGPGDTDYPIKSSINGDGNYSRFATWTLLEGGRVYCVDNDN